MLRARDSESVRAGERAFAAFAPSSVGIARDDRHLAEGESRLDVVVDQWERGVGGVHVRLVGALSADMNPAEFAALGLRRGEPVVLHVPAAAVSVYPADGGAPTR